MWHTVNIKVFLMIQTELYGVYGLLVFFMNHKGNKGSTD